MEQELKIHQPGKEKRASKPDFDESTNNIIHRHLTDINDTITDEDIRNVKIDFKQHENNHESNIEKRRVVKKIEIVNEGDDLSPLWNIFS
jgi:hypothetical protein